MNRRLLGIVVGVGLGLTVWGLAGPLAAVRLPGDHLGYEPDQPLRFSHRLHAGDLEIGCLYCHGGAEQSRHAGLPAASTCMNCHRFVSSTWGAVRAEDELAQKEKRSPQRIVAPELRKLYDALGLGDDLKPDPRKAPRPIAWTQVHNLPDFVYFDHSRHVHAGVDCQTCHGPVQTMERVRQVADLSMGWCVNCHRDATAHGIKGQPVQASTDCVTCHH